MKVDTLLLSACGTKGNGIIGSLMTLISKKIIDLKNIDTYICCSGGAIIGLLLSCGFNLQFINKLSSRLEYKSLLDINNLNNLFDNCGLFENTSIYNIIEKILFKKFNLQNITLKMLYEKTDKTYIAKVYNLSKNKEEYISYKNYPDLSVSTLIQMTSCIPLLFKPIKYNDEYYLDGGLSGNMVYSKDYCECDIENIGLFDYMQLLSNSIFEKYEFDVENNARIVKLDIFSESCFDFNIDNNKKKEFIEKSVETTLDHIKKYKL